MKQLCVTGPLPNSAPKVEAVLAAFKVRLSYTLYNNLRPKMSLAVLFPLQCERDEWKKYIKLSSK
jgi:hypothetical protein